MWWCRVVGIANHVAYFHPATSAIYTLPGDMPYGSSVVTDVMYVLNVQDWVWSRRLQEHQVCSLSVPSSPPSISLSLHLTLPENTNMNWWGSSPGAVLLWGELEVGRCFPSRLAVLTLLWLCTNWATWLVFGMSRPDLIEIAISLCCGKISGKIVIRTFTNGGKKKLTPEDDCMITIPQCTDRKSTRLNSSHVRTSRMPSSAWKKKQQKQQQQKTTPTLA